MLRFHSLRVADVRPDAEDAVAVSLQVPEELQGEYRGSAGQHVVLRTQIDGEETRRTYSLVNAPGEWPLRIVARVHPVGRMSRYLAEQLHAGDHVDVLPPNGSFTPRLLTPEASALVLRPEWIALAEPGDGPLQSEIQLVRFQGSYTDYVLAASSVEILAREVRDQLVVIGR